MIEANLLCQVRALSAAEQIELMGIMWESFTPDESPVTEEEKRLLDARLADLTKEPDDQRSWRDVLGRLRQRLD